MIETPLRVLHVAESMASGTLSYVQSISTKQAAEAADVAVLYARRPDTPTTDDLTARFAPSVELLSPVDAGSTSRNAIGLARRLRAVHKRFDVVHLHSSVAGGVGRLALPRRQGVFYSPHGFPFLRLDLPKPARWVARSLERYLASRSTLVLSSESELQIARGWPNARAGLLQSGVSRQSIMQAERSSTTKARLRVVMVGRVVYQKAPWRFARLSRELHELADFVWVGGGDSRDVARWIGDAPVSLVDWMPSAQLEEYLANSDVILFPTLWEGLSLSLALAQGVGLPAVVSDAVGNRDSVVHGETGYVCADDEQLLSATKELLTDSTLRHRMSEAARRWALERLIDDEIGRQSLALYQTALTAQG